MNTDSAAKCKNFTIFIFHFVIKIFVIKSFQNISLRIWYPKLNNITLLNCAELYWICIQSLSRFGFYVFEKNCYCWFKVRDTNKIKKKCLIPFIVIFPYFQEMAVLYKLNVPVVTLPSVVLSVKVSPLNKK